MSGAAPVDFRQLWEEAIPWNRYLHPEMDRFSLWDGVTRHVRLPEWSHQLARSTPVRRFLVLAEDWCGDAANTVPVVAKLVEATPNAELRVLPRDDYPEVMEHYLTNGSQSIPIVIGLGQDWREAGRWGPRPSELQTWVVANRTTLPTDERYREVRRWYAQDRGEATIKEVWSSVGGIL